MERDDERPDEDTGTGEGAAESEAGGQPAGGETGAEKDEPSGEAEFVMAPEGQAGEPGRLLMTVLVSGGMLLFALAFFMAGFWVHVLLDDDDGGGSGGTSASLTSESAADDPAWGPEDARVTIEEFADFQCPYCSTFTKETLPKLRDEYGDKVRFIYRDFPLSNIHPNAQKAAEAAQCAQEQEQFWPYHDLLYANQDALAEEDLRKHAEQVGLNMEEFNECLDSSAMSWEVLLDQQDGANQGVSGTPAFLINGLLISGAQPFEQFQAIIERALGTGG